MNSSSVETAGAAHFTPPIGSNAVEKLAGSMNRLLANVFAVYVMTKNFHWHVSGPHFRDYHRLLDEQGDQVLAMVDPLAERVRKLGSATLRSIRDIDALRSIPDSEAEGLSAADMLGRLAAATRALLLEMRELHQLCEELGDVATLSLLDGWIDQAEGRLWFLGASISDRA